MHSAKNQNPVEENRRIVQNVKKQPPPKLPQPSLNQKAMQNQINLEEANTVASQFDGQSLDQA